MVAACPSRLLPLEVGHRFAARTGRRRVLYSDDLSYLQRDQRRYLCRVLAVEHERYLDHWRRPELCCRCEVEAIGC